MGPDIYTTILEEIRSFENDKIKITDSYYYNQFDVIKRIILYDASVFESGEFDSEGFKKFFKNISNWRSIIASKQIDFDSKDILAISENEDSYYPTFFFVNELKYWIKTNKVGKLINEICWNLPKFGSVVVKRSAKNKLDLVDLRNFKNDPACKYLTDARYINEVHYYSPYELQEMSSVWDKNAIKKVLARYENSKEDIKVYERYGVVKEGWLDPKSTEPNKLVKGLFIVADVNTYADNIKNTEGLEKYVVLYSDTYDNLPYEEGHWMKMLGRWLAVGVTEALFDAQIRENQLVNIKSKGLWWSARKLYQTRDGIVAKNLLTDVTDGDILTVKDEIRPIVNEERNLQAFAQEERSWDDYETRTTFSHEIVRGEAMPSGTPLGSVYLQQQMASSFFDLKREDIGLFFKEVIMNQVIPIFKEEKYEKHILLMAANSSEELNKFEEMVINYRHANEVVNFILKNKTLPTSEQSEMLKSMIAAGIRSKKQRYIELPAGFYDNLKYRLDITITGEEINIQAKMSSLQVILQMLMSNPNLLSDPFVKKTLFKMLNYAGIDPTDYETERTEELSVESLLGTGVQPSEKYTPKNIKILKGLEEKEEEKGSPPRLRIPTATTPVMGKEEMLV